MSNKTYTEDDRIPELKNPRLGLLKNLNKAGTQNINKLVISCLEQANFSAAAIYLVNMLAFKLQCDRVSIGMLSGKHIQLSALSNSASFDPKTNFILGITAAMNESVDEASTIVFPSPNKPESPISVAHQQLTKLQGERTVCTIPLQHHGRYIGALCLERSGNKKFDVAEIQQAEEIAQSIGPLLHLLHQEQRSFTKRLIDDLHHSCTDIFGRDKIVSGVVSISLIFVLTFLSLFSASYRVTADVVMEGSIRSEERRVGKACRSRWSRYH